MNDDVQVAHQDDPSNTLPKEQTKSTTDPVLEAAELAKGAVAAPSETQPAPKPAADPTIKLSALVGTATFEPSDAAKLINELEALQTAQTSKFDDQTSAAVLARLALLADRLSSARAPESVFRLAVIAARAAAAGPAYAPFATMIVDGLEDQMGPNAPAYLVLRGLATSFLGVLAILALFAIGSFLVIYLSRGDTDWVRSFQEFWYGATTNILVVSAVFGLLGSLVSVLLRLGDFDGSRRSRQFLILTGAALPFIAVIFALVVCALFASGIVGTSFIKDPMDGTNLATFYFYVVLGFVSGFSERFATNLLGTFEGSVSAGKDKTAESKPAA